MTASTYDRLSNRGLESSLERFFHRRVSLAGGMAIKMAATIKGLPDRLVLLPGGHVYLVELKQTSGRVSDAQRVMHQRISRLGVSVVVLSGYDEIIDWLRESIDAASGLGSDKIRPGESKVEITSWTDLTDTLGGDQ